MRVSLVSVADDRDYLLEDAQSDDIHDEGVLSGARARRWDVYRVGAGRDGRGLALLQATRAKKKAWGVERGGKEDSQHGNEIFLREHSDWSQTARGYGDTDLRDTGSS